jgi:EmrB/QacA subfamily drug resistance transporter
MDNKKRNQILIVLFCGVLMGALDIAIVGPALTAIQKGFGVNDRLLTWVFSIYVLFSLIGTPLMAKLSDQFGRRPVYIANILLFALGSLIVAVAYSYNQVLVGRAIQGFGAGGIFPVATAVIGDTFPAEKRGSALGLIGAVFGVAFMIGPIIGGLLLSASWRWLFLINLPLAAAIVILAVRILPAIRPARSGPFDFLGMGILAACLACLAIGLNQIDTSRIPSSLVSWEVLPFLLGAICLAPLLIWREKRSNNPVLRLDLFTNRQMILSYILSMGAGIGESVLVFMPLLAVAAFSLTSSQASYLLLPLVLAMALVSPLIGRLLDRFGSKTVVFSGTFFLVVGMICLGTLASLAIGFFLLAGALVGAGLSSLLGAPIRYIMLNEASSQDRSVAQGVVTLSGSIGQLIGSALVGAVAASTGGGVPGYSSAYLAVGILSVILIAAASRLKGRAAELATVVAHKQAAM